VIRKRRPEMVGVMYAKLNMLWGESRPISETPIEKIIARVD